MKPVLFKIPNPDNSSFCIREQRHAYHYDQLHFHPEYQISLILEGEGLSAIGNHLNRFRPGDIYMIGPNVPHVFKNDPDYYEKKNSGGSHVISLFFGESSFGHHFFQLPEMEKVRTFLLESVRGIKANQDLAQRLRPLLLDLLNASGARSLIGFWNVLNEMALSREKQFLSATINSFTAEGPFSRRINRVFRYVSDNFDRPISLDEAAGTVNLSKYAFCRFFKRITHQSFISYLNEFRVGVACRLLRRTDYTIARIGYVSGFNNLSNFNRQFKKVMRSTPKEYREMQKQLLIT